MGSIPVGATKFMYFSAKTVGFFNCSLERAFKTAILCDVSKIHTGYWLMPRITHCSEDENWGEINSTKKVYAAKSISQPGGYVSTDHVVERIDNEKWVIEVKNFQSWMLGFHTFRGTWKVTEMKPECIQIDYAYDLHFKGLWFLPLNWLFTKLFWTKYMKKVLANIKVLAENQEPYLYS